MTKISLTSLIILKFDQPKVLDNNAFILFLAFFHYDGKYNTPVYIRTSGEWENEEK